MELKIITGKFKGFFCTDKNHLEETFLKLTYVEPKPKTFLEKIKLWKNI